MDRHTATTLESALKRMTAAQRHFEDSELAWNTSLRDAFGKEYGKRRYDWDQSAHPEACRRLYAEREYARGEYFALAGVRRNTHPGVQHMSASPIAGHRPGPHTTRTTSPR